MKARFLISRIRAAAKEELASPREFFEENRIRYTQLAKSIARATMVALQPEDISNEEWQQQIDKFLADISSTNLENPIGLRIGQGGRTAALKQKLGKRGDDPNVNTLTDADILEWVKDEKNLTEEDQRTGAAMEGRDIESTARTISYVIQQQYFGFADKDYSALQKRIEDFVDRKAEIPSLTAYLPAIALAWINIFSVRFPSDIKTYQTERLRKIVKRRQ